MKPIIIGYDPGTTAALAIIDTSKNILYLKSKKEFKKKELFESIIKKGMPIIVASDRSPLPKSVEKLASSLNCKTYEPPENLSNLEKYNIVKDYLDFVKNDHQRDALASALKAYQSYSKLFMKTDKTVSYLGLSEFYGKILKALIEGEAENISEGINLILNKVRERKEDYVERKDSKINAISSKDIEKMRDIINRQENDIQILKKYNETLNKKLEKSDEKFKERKIKSENFNDERTAEMNKHIYKIENKIEMQKIAMEKMKAFRKLENKGYIPIIELSVIKPEELATLNQMLDIEGRVLSTKSFINIHLLNDYKIQALIVPNNLDEEVYRNVDFPIISDEEIKKEEIDDITAVRKEEFDEKLKKARKSGFIQWVNEYKKRRL